MATRFDLTQDAYALYQGADWRFDLYFTDDVQVVALTPGTSGGTFQLGWGGEAMGLQVTQPIAFDAAAAGLTTALERLSGIGAGKVNTVGPNGGPWEVDLDPVVLDRTPGQLLVADGNGLVNGGVSVSERPVDLTGFAAKLQIRPFEDSEAVFLSISDGTGITLAGSSGLAQVSVPGVTTAVMDFGSLNKARYDCRLTDGAGHLYAWLYGDVRLIRRVSR